MTHERELLILTFLRARQMHGYQLTDVLDTGIGQSLGIGRSTLYSLLRRLEERGWIVSREEQEGARPVRRVYDLTDQGRAAFERLLRESLRQYAEPSHASLVSLAHADMLPPAEALPLLRERRAQIQDRMRQLEDHQAHGTDGSGHAQLHSAQVVVDTLARHLEVDIEAVDQIIGRLESATSQHGE